MKFFKNLPLFGLLFVAICDKTNQQEITDDRRFHCTWHGGSAARVSCDCESWAEMTIKADSINSFSTSEILINGCKLVKIEANAISGMRNLRAISLSNIESLYFDSDSINWFGYRDNRGQIEEERFDITVPSLRVNVYKSNISEISSHAFSGRISEITFEDVYVQSLQPLAFVNLLQTEKITIRNSVLKNVAVQSFKKFSTEFLELTSVFAEEIPSRAFSNITVYKNVTIHNCTFNSIRSGGFTIFNPNVLQVTNTNVNRLNGEAFKVISRGIILFRNNNFGMVDNGAFRGITVRRDIVLGDNMFIFDSNRLANLSYAALSMSQPNVQFRNVYIEEPCDCTETDRKIQDSSYYEEIQCRHDYEYMTVNYFKTHFCSESSNYYIILIVSCVIGTLVTVIIVSLLLYYKFVYRTRKYGDKNTGKNGNLSLIVPDGRTYRETELHVIVERTDLLTTDL